MRVLILGAATAVATVLGANAMTGDLSAQVIEDEMRPMSGQYQSTISLLSIDLPDAPPQVASMMGQVMNREFDYCLTPEDIEEGYRSTMNRSQQGECSYQRFRAVDGEIDAEMTCSVDGRQMNMSMQGTGSPTASDVTMTMSGDFGIGPGTLTMRVVQQRTGDCS